MKSVPVICAEGQTYVVTYGSPWLVLLVILDLLRQSAALTRLWACIAPCLGEHRRAKGEDARDHHQRERQRPRRVCRCHSVSSSSRRIYTFDSDFGLHGVYIHGSVSLPVC